MPTELTHAVCADELNDRFGTPSPRAVGKVQPQVDDYSAAFIARSPFCVLATASAEGACDASPKGGEPGFVRVADPQTLLIPDYKGNSLFFGMRNLLENPHVGLIFLIPGENWTLRVGGRAQIVDDEETLALLPGAKSATRPQLAIKVTVEECFLHCPKAFNNADLWNPEKYGRYEDFPPYLRPAKPAEAAPAASRGG